MVSSGPEWTVLLLGGASGVGKSRLAQPLAARLGVPLTAVDDIQLALESVTTPEQHPLLHYWRTHFGEWESWSEKQRVAHQARVCREVYHPVLRAVIADHLETHNRLILEGDHFLPELATCTTYGDQPQGGRVRSLFVSEPEEGQLVANYGSREGSTQEGRARLSARYDAFLRDECARHGVPVVRARPWHTVVDRALVTLAE